MRLYISDCSRGAAEALAQVVNNLFLSERPWEEPVDATYIMEYCLVEYPHLLAYVGTSPEKPTAFIWAYEAREWLAFMNPVAPQPDPETLEHLLAAAYWWLRNRGFNGIVDVVCGPRFGRRCSTLADVIDGFEKVTATLMEWRQHTTPRPRRGVEIEPFKWSELPQLLEVYNKAFSRYEWFKPLTLEQFRRWVENFKPEILVARLNDEIAGFVSYRVYRALDGIETMMIEDLAVHPKHQGKGIGSTLLAHALAKAKAKRTILYAIHGLEEYYMRFGFRIEKEHAALRTTLDNLPKINVNVETQPQEGKA